jgi:hypothetical protein
MKPFIAVAVLAVACCSSGYAQSASKPLGAQLRVRWDGFKVILIKDGVRHPYDIRKEVAAYSINSVKC